MTASCGTHQLLHLLALLLADAGELGAHWAADVPVVAEPRVEVPGVAHLVHQD